ncbi:unnamed protein product [Parascedosporium putredinis]|uniref:Rrp15p-domain-containing protein n=1 Tax=Parascedosporium putredinis TaxID=1442378 RepID=A0A9P1M7D3_9PEZI|nr:unnamed protein product [Parascedosporium putredinis]CAI7987583.1 unnamed protein product [Parascedosporium putredinis]
MAGKQIKKRGPSGSASQPYKKRRKQPAYESESEPEEAQDFDAVNLLDSEDDIENAKVDDGAATDSGSSSDEDTARTKRLAKKPKKISFKPTENENGSESAENDDNEEEEEEEEEESDGAWDDSPQILSTKLSTTKRADPVLSRSADAQSAARAAADSVLEVKARRHMKEEKLRALEKGRVRNIMAPEEGSGRTTSDVLDEERRLRRVAQRGVVKLFNAVRAAQVKASVAERSAKEGRVIGIDRREEKVNEMSKRASWT